MVNGTKSLQRIINIDILPITFGTEVPICKFSTINKPLKIRIKKVNLLLTRSFLLRSIETLSGELNPEFLADL